MRIPVFSRSILIFQNISPMLMGISDSAAIGHESISQFVHDVFLNLRRGIPLVATLELSRPTLRQSLVSTAVIDSVNQSLADGSAWKEINAPF